MYKQLEYLKYFNSCVLFLREFLDTNMLALLGSGEFTIAFKLVEF